MARAANDLNQRYSATDDRCQHPQSEMRPATRHVAGQDYLLTLFASDESIDKLARRPIGSRRARARQADRRFPVHPENFPAREACALRRPLRGQYRTSDSRRKSALVPAARRRPSPLDRPISGAPIRQIHDRLPREKEIRRRHPATAKRVGARHRFCPGPIKPKNPVRRRGGSFRSASGFYRPPIHLPVELVQLCPDVRNAVAHLAPIIPTSGQQTRAR